MRLRRSPDLVVALLLATAVVARAQTPPEPATADAKPDAGRPDAKSNDEKDQTFFGFGSTKSKEPITITSDSLEYEYKDGIIVYRGDVLAIQGEVKIKSNELRITLAKSDDGNKKKGGGADATGALDDASASKLQSVVATGSVRIDQGTKWAVGGKATFDQSNRTLVLTESPILHDGPNEVAGDRVVVYLDENRSVVEGGRKRVKAVLFPGKDGKAGAPAAAKAADGKEAPAAKATEGKPAPGAVSKAGEAAR